MQVFAKRFYGFDPARRPIVGFGMQGNRDALIATSRPGDLLAFVGTQGEPTRPDERGRLLGIVEFARIPVDATDVVDPAVLEPHDFRTDGTLLWPKALPVLRAWRFNDPRLKLIDVLKEQLIFEATVRATLLDDDDARAVLAIPKTEIELPTHQIFERLRSTAAVSLGTPTTGPAPAHWTGIVTRNPDAEAWTYAMRFGKRSVWKIGHTQDVKGRLAEINQHVPHEELGEQWVVALQQKWTCSQDAYAMEQRVLAALAEQRTEGERVRCPEHVLQSTWTVCLAGKR